MTLEQHDALIERIELELKYAKSERHKLFVSQCNHNIIDKSFVNGHNGEDVDWFVCKHCQKEFKSMEAT